MTKKKESTKEVANPVSSDDDILKLLNQAAELDGQNQAEIGGNRVPYIKCISKAEDPILDKTSPDYIPKAVYKGFCVPTHKLNLGEAFFFTVMGIFSIYEEKVKPKEKKAIPQIIGYWMPKQAQQVPIAAGEYFDRIFVGKDGETHILSPVFWVFGLIKGHEDLGLHNIVFRSTASGNAKALQKILADDAMSCRQVVKVIAEKKEFKDFNNIIFRPLFEKTERANFTVKNGKLIPEEWTKAEIDTYAKMYLELQSSYSGHKMVADRQIANNVASIPEHTETKF